MTVEDAINVLTETYIQNLDAKSVWRNALILQMPKKPIKDGCYYHCAVCGYGRIGRFYKTTAIKLDYCPKCGNKQDWGD